MTPRPALNFEIPFANQRREKHRHKRKQCRQSRREREVGPRHARANTATTGANGCRARSTMPIADFGRHFRLRIAPILEQRHRATRFERQRNQPR